MTEWKLTYSAEYSWFGQISWHFFKDIESFET